MVSKRIEWQEGDGSDMKQACDKQEAAVAARKAGTQEVVMESDRRKC